MIEEDTPQPQNMNKNRNDIEDRNSNNISTDVVPVPNIRFQWRDLLIFIPILLIVMPPLILGCMKKN